VNPRLSTNERIRRRKAISDLVHRQVDQVIAARLREQMSVVCIASTHDGCTYADCLCRCHNGEETPTSHRCQVCGMGAVWDIQWGHHAGGQWLHVIAPQDHPAQPVRKKEVPL
jgi:hypothetical protein